MTRLHEIVARSARQYPERVAVEDPDRETSLDYQALHTLSDRLADELLRIGVRPGDRVGIYAPKSIGTVVSIFGILKAGAAYIPVDPDAPPARNAYIFKNAAVKAMIVDHSRAEGLRAALGDGGLSHQEPYESGEALAALSTLGADLTIVQGPNEDASQTAQEGDALAYILYTSGSTGTPKGVMHTHSSALSFIDWCSETFEPTEHDRFSSHAPFHFDLSILDIYVPLKHGATLVLVGEQLGKQPLRLAAVIAERRISMWYSTPSILRLLVEYGRMEQYDYSALRVVNFAGEVFPVKHLRALKAIWPQPRYFNLYGPTETNVCTYYEVPADIPEDRTEPFPIGTSCSGDVTRVMDEQDRDVPPGEEGELYVWGGSVMQGYWNMPERSRKAFFVDDDGKRWYKTGDVVKEDADGNYLFIGRRDRMVKRRGYRVELGEIEAALYRHPVITEAAVIALPDDENGVLIKAFLSCSTGAHPSLIQLKRFCAENLPLYMVPDRFSIQPALPKTSTDKMDYQKLKELA